MAQMERYRGQSLGPSPRIALVVNDALGNFAIATPLARAVKRLHPECTLDYYGGTRTAELEEAAVGSGCLFDWRCDALGRSPAAVFEIARSRMQEIGGYHLVVNLEASELHRVLAAFLGERGFVCGPCIAPDGRGMWDYPDDERGDLWRDRNWASEDLAQRYSFLQTGFIAEVFLRLAYVPPFEDAEWPGGVPRYAVPHAEPSIATPPILISTGATLPEKTWPIECWVEILRELPQPVGLLGAPPKRQERFYHTAHSDEQLVQSGLVKDLRGRLTLPEVVGAVAKADLIVTVDNGILHFAAAFDRPTVGLYRREVIKLWAPPNPNLIALSSESGVADIPVDDVRKAVAGFVPSVGQAVDPGRS
jgi:ADP-heptose:LPS heptosyltransferase